SESPTGQVRLMESILERNNMKRAIARHQEQGRSWCGRYDRSQNKEVPETSLEQDRTGTAGGNVFPHAGKTEGDP
ncbi:MAG: hypothetical protein J7K15_15825, partial [Deltaproteobacteria bacterium]|nr:hypothetical protein [Deltaproteobacteria bacterium]